MAWSPEQIVTLTTMWNGGEVVSRIAAALSSAPGGRVTTSAVIGKAHRLHLPGRPNPVRRGLGINLKPKRVSGPKISKAPKEPKVKKSTTAPSADSAELSAADHRRAFFMRLGTNGHACTAPLGEPKTPEFKICDQPAVVGRSFCIDHCVEYLRPVRAL